MANTSAPISQDEIELALTKLVEHGQNVGALSPAELAHAIIEGIGDIRLDELIRQDEERQDLADSWPAGVDPRDYLD